MFSWVSCLFCVSAANGFVSPLLAKVIGKEQHLFSSERQQEFSSERQQEFILPIFPLRKAVRVPTDTLTLNLYEERYLAMSEYILSQPLLLFGALYCSDKPQIVHQGTGPIVPLVEVGNVGTVFEVYDHQEGMIPTADETYDRRRIRLEALGVGLFEIVEIIHPGYKPDDCPYILCKVKSLDKDDDADKMDVQSKEQLLDFVSENIEPKNEVGASNFTTHDSFDTLRESFQYLNNKPDEQQQSYLLWYLTFAATSILANTNRLDARQVVSLLRKEESSITRVESLVPLFKRR